MPGKSWRKLHFLTEQPVYISSSYNFGSIWKDCKGLDRDFPASHGPCIQRSVSRHTRNSAEHLSMLCRWEMQDELFTPEARAVAVTRSKRMAEVKKVSLWVSN